MFENQEQFLSKNIFRLSRTDGNTETDYDQTGNIPFDLHHQTVFRLVL